MSDPLLAFDGIGQDFPAPGQRTPIRVLDGISFDIDRGKFVASTDDCPVGLGERTIGAEVGTMSLALRVAAECDHVVFGPLIAAQRELKDGSLVEIKVRGWNLSEALFLVCDAERVLARVQVKIVETIRSQLDDIPAP